MERETWPRSAGPGGAPKPAPGSLGASCLPHSRRFGDPWSTKRDCRGIAPFPFPQQSPGKSPNPLKNPNPAMRARREPKGLRQRLSSTFWKGKTLWIRFNFPAMTWKGERRGGETYPRRLFPLLCALEKQFGGRAGLVGTPPAPRWHPQHPPGHPSTPCHPTPGLGSLWKWEFRRGDSCSPFWWWHGQDEPRPRHQGIPPAPLNAQPKGATSGGLPCHGGPGPYPALALGASALGCCSRGPGSGWRVPLPKKQLPPKAALFSGGEAQITGDGGNVNSPPRNAGAPRGDSFKRLHVLALENRAGIWHCWGC